MGSYSFFNQGIDTFLSNAYVVPTMLPAGSLHDLLTIFLDPVHGEGGIRNVVNGVGGSSTVAHPTCRSPSSTTPDPDVRAFDRGWLSRWPPVRVDIPQHRRAGDRGRADGAVHDGPGDPRERRPVCTLEFAAVRRVYRGEKVFAETLTALCKHPRVLGRESEATTPALPDRRHSLDR